MVEAEREEYGFAKKDISIPKFIERFLEYSAANHRSSTTNRYRAVTNHFRSFLGDKRSDTSYVYQITSEVIDQYKVYRKGEWVNPNGSKVESDDDVKEYTRKGARAHTINFELENIFSNLYSMVSFHIISINEKQYQFGK